MFSRRRDAHGKRDACAPVRSIDATLQLNFAPVKERTVEARPTLKKDWVITAEAFEKLLALLDADRERAAVKYEELRHTLIRYLGFHGSPRPEEHADKAIDRTARKIDEGLQLDRGNYTGYFCKVAKYVLNEYWDEQENSPASLDELPRRRQPHYDPDEEQISNLERTEKERTSACLDCCLRNLPIAKREMIQDYYRAGSRENIKRRSSMAGQRHVSSNALRIQISRIKKHLEACLNRCLKDSSR